MAQKKRNTPKNAPIILDAETVIINLLREDKETYLPVNRIMQLVYYVYDQLTEGQYLDGTEVVFNVNFDAIERTVIYNDYYFALIDETIYLLRDLETIQNKCIVDEKLRSIIEAFCKTNVA